jgi:hypothetical protein
MYFPAKSTALLCLVLCVGTSSLSQNEPNCRRTVIANILDSAGIVRSGLSGENFDVIYKGRSTKPDSVVYTKGPRRVVVLLDVSGSMCCRDVGGAPKWQIARDAAWELVAALPPASKAGLMTFSEKTEVRAELSTDHKPIHDWLDGEVARHPESFYGSTALYGAVQAAVAQLQPSEPGDAIYLITDGDDNSSKVSRSKVEDALRSSGVRLFALIVNGGGFFTTREEHGGLEDLLSVIRGSGGSIEIAGSTFDNRMKDQLKLRSRQLSSEIAEFYSITVQLPETSEKPERLEINVIGGNGHRRKDLLVAYPRKVSPCRIETVQR